MTVESQRSSDHYTPDQDVVRRLKANNWLKIGIGFGLKVTRYKTRASH